MAKKLQPLHWFPFDTDRWLGEIAGGLTAEQKGGLVDLLSIAWTQQPPCTLPDDDGFLSVRSGLGTRWKRNRAAVLAHFKADGGRLVCGWLLEMYNEQLAKYTNRSNANRDNVRKRNRPSKEDTNPSTNGATNRTTNRSTNGRQNTEAEADGGVAPVPSGTGVLRPPASNGALAPVGAALRAADVTGAADKAARRKQLEGEYVTRLQELLTTWAARNPGESEALVAQARSELELPDAGLSPLQERMLRGKVRTLFRELPRRRPIPDLDAWIAEREAQEWVPDELHEEAGVS